MNPKLEELLKALEDNKEFLDAVKAKYLKPEELIETKDPAVRSAIDRAVQKGIEGFKEKGMLSILDEKKSEWKKTFYDEFTKEHGIITDPKVIALEDRLALIEKREKELAKREQLETARSTVAAKLKEKGISSKMADFFNLELAGDALDESVKAVTGLFTEAVEKAVAEKLRVNNSIPGGKHSDFTVVNPFSKKHFNLTKQAEIMEKDPDLAVKLQNLAKGD